MWWAVGQPRVRYGEDLEFHVVLRFIPACAFFAFAFTLVCHVARIVFWIPGSFPTHSDLDIYMEQNYNCRPLCIGPTAETQFSGSHVLYTLKFMSINDVQI